MATVYGNQYQGAYVAKPKVNVKPGDVSGDIRFMYFDYTAAGALALNDVIKLGKLPKGARVVEACLSTTDLGTAGNLDLGWADSAALNSSGVAVEAADDDGFIDNMDVATAASTKLMSSAFVPGMLKEFDAEVDIQAKVATATTAAGTIKGYIAYVII